MLLAAERPAKHSSALPDTITLRHEEYGLIASLMFERSGVFLDVGKIPMIQARLNRRLHELGLSSFKDYCKVLRSNEAEVVEFVNVLTTHKTDFFRENEHFTQLRNEILPSIAKSTQHQRLRVWSAACSTGEEVYTLAMVLDDFFQSRPELAFWDYKVLGTDIDTSVLARAEEGIYSREVLAPVNPFFISRFMLRGKGQNAGLFRVGKRLRTLVKFRHHNLLEDPGILATIGFDIIFLRNVLIYFQEETREFVIDKLHRTLKPGGYLFIGHSENLINIAHKFKPLGGAVFQKLDGRRER